MESLEKDVELATFLTGISSLESTIYDIVDDRLLPHLIFLLRFDP